MNMYLRFLDCDMIEVKIKLIKDVINFDVPCTITVPPENVRLHLMFYESLDVFSLSLFYFLKKGEPLFDKLCKQSYMYRTMVLEVSVVTSKIIQNAQFVSGLTYYFFFFYLRQLWIFL